IIHSPAVPAPSSPVRITVNAGGTSLVQLVHRLDNNNADATWQRTAMSDDGSGGGDETAGDGIYTATLTQYPGSGSIVQFYAEATAAGRQTTLLPKLGRNRPAMYIVDDAPSSSDLQTQRFVISQYDRDAISSSGYSNKYQFNFPRMSNHYFNATFIHNERDIYYNAEIRKSGSPFTRSGGNGLDHGKWKLPGDRLLRGRGKTVIDPSGGNGGMRHNDRMARYFLYQLGHPINEFEFVRVGINDSGFNLREDMEPIANDFLRRNFEGGTNGTLLRIDDQWWFEDFNNDGTAPRRGSNADWRYKNTDEAIRYHSEWIMRSRETDYEYTAFTEFLKNIRSGNESTLNRIIDPDMSGLNAAVRGYDADWDTLTLDRGKNGYFYRRPDGLWMLVHWDGDRTFENGRLGMSPLGGLNNVATYFNKPFVRRYMNHYLTELLDNHTRGSARTAAYMRAEEDASNAYPMDTNKFNNWFNNRSSRIRSFIGAPLNANFSTTSPNSPTSAADFDLSGTAPSSVYSIRISGHPEAVVTWNNTTNWTASGITLKTGNNSLVVEGVDSQGNVVESTSFSVNKNGNAP
ncbi:MAG: hypothetical protein P8J87_06010, partial [Verrucomicrobiales bacterium]|nr:hypothetical protein [Verrucomicrobiales bacterium]